ncbi:hypothetical protein [Natrinema salsiterrestre]|uniref:Uncharacterized protein n=1 Tax=Natrinema salsiterrestre TaxID=2950540 RepID=A0A9Q4Q4C2_9EURY|nr:hypothetical protein [Natrinema salsiterrestre]MDF9748426.1 hypothetical protein [Natrinema salsiterrestre]
MTESDSNDVQIYACPSPDDCPFTGTADELLEHVNSEHSGEYRQDNWPDTPAGRAGRPVVEPDDEDDVDDQRGDPDG